MPLADLVSHAIDPVLARQGFSQSDLILHWEDIVGARLAAYTRPIKLQWPPRPTGRVTAAQPATLLVRVEGGLALELQHMADQVIARINAHLGWRCVGRLALRQGPIDRLEGRGSGAAPVSDEALAAAEAQLPGVIDDGLRRALARLGVQVANSTRSAKSQV